MPVPKLPPEITDCVIDFAHNDTALLCKCGLVCRDWLSSSRYHLFQHKYVDASTDSEWEDIVASPYVTIIPYIRHVSLHARSYDLYGQESAFSNERFLHPDLKITSLRLKNIDKFFPHQGIRSLSNISVLVLENSCPSFSDLSTFISQFGCLTSLSLLGIDIRSDSDLYSDSPPASLRTLILHLDPEPMEVILEWFMTCPSQPKILGLDLRELFADNITTSKRFMQSLGEDLTDVTLDLLNTPEWVADYREELREILDLSAHKQLRSLHLYLDLWEFWSAPWILECLRDAPRLEILTLTICYDLCCEMSEMTPPEPWSELDNILSASKFSELKSVHFLLTGFGESIEPIIRDRLKYCESKKLLSFGKVEGTIEDSLDML